MHVIKFRQTYMTNVTLYTSVHTQWWTMGMDTTMQPILARAMAYACGRYGHVLFPQHVRTNPVWMLVYTMRTRMQFAHEFWRVFWHALWLRCRCCARA